MTRQEYEQKRAELWYEYTAMLRRNCATRYVFDKIFDRAYALGKQEKDGVDLKKLDKMLDDALEKETKESLNQWLSNISGEEETVISGWVARSNDGPNDLGLRAYTVKPDRMKNRNGWNGHGEMSYLIDCRLFPDLTWESEPELVEIIIKRKKNG